MANPATTFSLIEGFAPMIQVSVTNTAGVSSPTLYGWIDYNGDGVFDPAESAAVAAADGLNTLNFPTIPAGSASATYARFPPQLRPLRREPHRRRL